MRHSWSHLAITILLMQGLQSVAGIPRAAAAEPGYPRLANYYLHGYVDPAHLVALAKWDLVILKTVWTEPQLAALRALNPDIKIYLYVCAYAVETPPNPADPWNVTAWTYARDFDLWWYDADGRIATDWPGSQMVNVLSESIRGPVAGEWLRFMHLLIQHLVQERPSIDGIFLDNFWTRLSWNQDRLRLDSDCRPSFHPEGCNGIPDDKNVLDLRWNNAMDGFARTLRSTFDRLQVGRARPLTILSNSSSDYFESLNGTMYEFFPGGSTPDYGSRHNYAWREAMFQWPGGYQVAPFRKQPYSVSVINSGWRGTTQQPQRDEDFERHKRFTLGSTLLGDGYYSLDGGTAGHGNLWWEPEFDANGSGKGYLGMPTGAAVSLPARRGPELVTNGTFTSALSSWSLSFPGAVGSGQVQEYPLGSLVEIVVQGLTNPGGSMQLSQSGLALQRDESYTLRLDGQAITPTDLEVTLTSSACPDNRCMKTWRFGLDGVSRQHAVSFVAPADATAKLTLLVRRPTLVRLRNISLQAGSRDLYRRDFDHGTVVVNYTTGTQMVDLGQGMQRLHVPGSTVFDGRSVSVDLVAAGDAVIYVRAGAAGAGAKPRAELLRPDVSLLTLTQPGRAVFRIGLPQDDHLAVRIFDVRGRLIQSLGTPGVVAAGLHDVVWDQTDRLQRSVGRGVYFVQVQTSAQTLHRKLVVER